MPPSDHQHPLPARSLPILDWDEYERYKLHTPGEALIVLRGLLDRNAQISVFFNEGRDMLLSMLLAIEQDRLVLDVGPEQSINRRAAEARPLYCVAQLDKVRVQFLLEALSPITHEGAPAFLSAFPKEVLRLQRREFYRLAAPVVRPLVCLMQVPLPGGDIYRHEARILDISGGGVGLIPPPDQVPFDTDLEIPGCRIELPGAGMLTCTLKVRQIGISFENRQGSRRAGCEFMYLSGAMGNLIQRYIIKAERERKARG